MRKFLPILGVTVALTMVGVMAQDETMTTDTGMVGSEMAASSSETGFAGTVQSVESGNPPVPNATIQYTGSVDSGSATSGPTGEYRVTGISPGTYVLNISADGYRSRTQQTVTVVEGVVAPYEPKMRKKETLVTFAAKFGWVGLPLLLCSVGAVTFVLERIIAYSRLNKGTPELLQSISDSLSQDNVMEAINACEERGTPIANVLKAGLLRYSQGLVSGDKPSKAEIQETMSEGATLELPEYERNLTWLSMIAVVSPLFGLLGTVTGMIKSFTVIALEGTNDPNALAGGISEALYTTAAGLTIAAPTLVFYAVFENFVNNSTIRIEAAATDTVNALIANK